MLTGATGFVGMELLARLVEEGENEVICLVRSSTQEEADARLAGVFARIFDELPAAAGAVTAMACDVGAEDLGLSPANRGALVERITSVIHCAASIAFDRTLEEARQVNTGGALRMPPKRWPAGRVVSRLAGQGEGSRVARGTGRCRGGRVADGDRAHREPAVGQAEGARGHVLAEQGR